jgi:hypothetical protein
MNGDYENCIKFGDAMRLCIGDRVEFSLRGFKGILNIRGEIKEIGQGGFLVSDGDFEYFIRNTEIRFIRKAKDKGVSNESKK